MRERLKAVVPPAAGLLIGWAVALALGGRGGPVLPPMPVPLGPAGPADPRAPDVVRAARVEVLDGRGQVAIVFTSENGMPVAIVSDNGKARRIDLAAVARKLQ